MVSLVFFFFLNYSLDFVPLKSPSRASTSSSEPSVAFSIARLPPPDRRGGAKEAGSFPRLWYNKEEEEQQQKMGRPQRRGALKEPGNFGPCGIPALTGTLGPLPRGVRTIKSAPLDASPRTTPCTALVHSFLSISIPLFMANILCQGSLQNKKAQQNTT